MTIQGRPGIVSGLFVAAMLTAAQIGIFFFAWRVAGLPFMPFDIFDWETRVLPGRLPINRLMRARVTIGADNQTARDVLWGALQAIDPALSWQLTCGVGEDAECGINLHLIGH